MSPSLLERARVGALLLRAQLQPELARRAKAMRRAVPLGVLRGKQGMREVVSAQAEAFDAWLVEQGIDDAMVQRVHGEADAVWMGIALLNEALLDLPEADQRVLRPWIAPELPDVPENVLRSILGKQALAAFRDRPEPSDTAAAGLPGRRAAQNRV